MLSTFRFDVIMNVSLRLFHQSPSKPDMNRVFFALYNKLSKT